MAGRRFSQADLDRWVADGIISADQRRAALADLDSRHPDDAGLTLTNLLYYSGGLLVLVAYSIFLGFQWEDLDKGGRVGISAASLIFFAVASQTLITSGRFRLPGELLQLTAVAAVPLLMFAVIDAAGLWPDEPSVRALPSEHRQYQIDLAWARMFVAGPAVLAAALAFWSSRSPYVLAAGVVAFIAVAVDVSLQAQGSIEEYDWSTAQSLLIASLGAVALIAGLLVRDASDRNHSLWLYLVGLGALAAGLGGLAFPEDAATAWGALWIVAALAVTALSLPLQERIFAAAGLLAVFSYLGKLVFEVFESANAALVLVLLGLIVLGIGMLYQRYNERLWPETQGG